MKKAKKKRPYTRDLTDRPSPKVKFVKRPPSVIPEVVAAIREMTDEQIAARVEFTTKGIPPFLVRGDFRAVMRRAFASLQRARMIRRAGPIYQPSDMEEMSRLVAAFHVCRHTPRAERDADWPKDSKDLAKLLAVQHRDIREAIYQSRYHAWEERYVPKISSAARISRIKDSLEYNVLRQDEVEDPSKVNANLYRTALQAEGAIQSAKGIQVNIDSNVLNLPEGMTEDKLRERIARLNRFTHAKEIPHAELGADGNADLPHATPDHPEGARSEPRSPEARTGRP